MWEQLGERFDGRATIVAFSTPGCAQCRTVQGPALEAVRQKLGEGAVRILNVECTSRPDLVKAFGVVTAPTTIVFAADSRLTAHNRGFASADKLIHQLKPPPNVSV
jgi:thioredoxin-like negative regulator of GroEL